MSLSAAADHDGRRQSVIGYMRVRRTFCFVDLCGFTSYTEARGDRHAVAVLGHLRTCLRARAEHHGVRITKWLGDGALLSGIDAGAVMACTLRVRADVEARRALRLRGGVCAGDVIMFEGDDYIGAVVNVAARLCQLAGPGQILLTSEVLDALADSDGYVALGEQRLDGLRTPVAVHAAPAALTRLAAAG